MGKAFNKKGNPTSQNVLESIKDIGDSAVKTLKKDVVRPEDLFNQILGFIPNEKYTGDIGPGEEVDINDIFSGKREADIKVKKQISLERKLIEQEKIQIEKKTNELNIQLHAIIEEVQKLATNTEGLDKEIKIASISAPIEPGVYHVIFFEKLLVFIKSFRKKVEDASVWLHTLNQRAQKRNYWNSYKKHGAKFFLSGEHYLSRSAG